MASDVNISLGIDDTQFTSKLRAADTAVKGFSATTSKSLLGMQTGLHTAGQGIETLNGKFEKLSAVLVGVGIVEFAHSLLESSNNMKDMADGLDISIARMMEMGVAASTAGGDLDKVAAMMGKMEIAAGQAADGNVQLRQAFADVGLSLKDLSSQSPDQVFNNIAIALAGVADPATRAAQASAIFGKTFKGLNFGQYVAGITETYGTMDKFGEAQKKAADLSESLNVKLQLVKASFVEILSPIVSAVTGTGTLEEKMSTAKDAAYLLAGGLAVIVGGQIVTGMQSLAGAAGALTTLMTAATVATGSEAAATGVLTAAEIALLKVKQASAAVKAESLAMQIAEARETLMTASAIAVEELRTAELAAAKRVLLINQAQLNVAMAEGAAATTALNVAQEVNVAATTTVGVASSGAAVGVGTLTASMTALAVSLGSLIALTASLTATAAVIQSLYNTFSGTGDGKNFINDMLQSFIEQRKESVKLTESAKQRIESAKAEEELAARTAELKKKMTEESEKAAKLLDAKKIKDVTIAYTAQAQSIRDNTANMLEQNKTAQDRIAIQTALIGQDKATSAAILASFDAQSKAKQELFKIDQEIAAFKAKVAADPNSETAKGAGKVLAAYEEQRKAIQGIVDKTYELTKAEGDRQASAEMTAYFLEMQTKAKDSMLTVTQDIADLTATDNEKQLLGVDRLIAKEKELAIAKRQSQLGEGQVMSQDEIDAINAKVDSSYSGLKGKTQDLIDKSRDFSTGWNKSMKQYVEDSGNAAAQAQALFAASTKGMEDAIIGFAKTGKFEFKNFVSSIVEMMMRNDIQKLMSGMFSGSKGGASSSGGFFSGLASMLGFAGGGLIPTNGPVMVGENGPEVISGAAGRTVTPNGQLGGSTQVTYNINAVDARSFQQMLAQQPELLYALTQKGSPRGGR
jgi:lambda family phage tail tape measure protein